MNKFLFAVARWGQRNERHQGQRDLHGERFLFAVARWGQRNWRVQTSSSSRRGPVSIRCREMGTAELPGELQLIQAWAWFLFAVARWGQRNAARELTVTAVSA